MQPRAAAELPSMMILPVVLIHALHAERVLLGEGGGGVVVASLDSGGQFSSAAFFFLANCLRSAFSTSAMSMLSSCADHADVDHVLDQLAQLGLRDTQAATSLSNGTE